MNKERFNEILNELSKLNETVETTTLLEELRKGYNEPTTVDNSKELEEANKKYKDLEALYIKTFRDNLNKTVEKETPKNNDINVDEPKVKVATFNDIFKEETNN